MGAQGTTTLDFGAFPGTPLATKDITGQTGILSGSLVEAWVLPAATADHTVGEHIIDPPRVVAATVVAGTGFTIYGLPRDGGTSMVHGVWNIAWVWN